MTWPANGVAPTNLAGATLFLRYEGDRISMGSSGSGSWAWWKGRPEAALEQRIARDRGFLYPPHAHGCPDSPGFEGLRNWLMGMAATSRAFDSHSNLGYRLQAPSSKSLQIALGRARQLACRRGLGPDSLWEAQLPEGRSGAKEGSLWCLE
jgi:hypothetical protein